MSATAEDNREENERGERFYELLLRQQLDGDEHNVLPKEGKQEMDLGITRW